MAVHAEQAGQSRTHKQHENWTIVHLQQLVLVDRTIF